MNALNASRIVRGPMMRVIALAVGGLLVGGVIACGDDESDSSGGGGGGTVPDTITMVPNAQPTYGWQMGNADTVEVARSSALGTPVWRTVSTDLDGIGSGLTHGTSGTGRDVTITTEAVLTVGISYRVRIVRQSGGSVVMKSFTVQP